MADADAGEDRILTVPNVVTVVRLLCVPVFLWLLFDQHQRAAAALLLGGLGATDFVDGYIARHFHQVSTVGKVLDPLADRILLIVGVSAILADGADRKSTRLNSSHANISYAVFCLKKKKSRIDNTAGVDVDANSA